MAAILPFIEQPAVEAETTVEAAEALDGFAEPSGFADARTPGEVIANQSAGLHRFVWTRALIAEWLAERKWHLEVDNDEVVFRLDQKLPLDLVPWSMTQPGGRKDRFPLWSTGNMKMATLSWDLPAGAPGSGGSCPGAAMAQPTIERADRIASGLAVTPDGIFLKLPAPGSKERIPFREERAICLFCYAEGGRFAYTDNMVAPILRYWWTKTMLATDEGMHEWVRFMADSLDPTKPGGNPPPVSGVRAQDRKPFRAVRVHSSGDYWSPRYAEAWVMLANEVSRREQARGEDAPTIFWSPTRTWARANFNWPSILAKLNTAPRWDGRQILNLIVRPSAYHVNDPAPGPLAPGNGGGTTCTTRVPEIVEGELHGHPLRRASYPDRSGRLHVLFDYVCPAYAKEGPGKAKTPGPEIVAFGADGAEAEIEAAPTVGAAEAAQAADDEINSCEANNCRKCWTEPSLRINYPLH